MILEVWHSRIQRVTFITLILQLMIPRLKRRRVLSNPDTDVLPHLYQVIAQRFFVRRDRSGFNRSNELVKDLNELESLEVDGEFDDPSPP